MNIINKPQRERNIYKKIYTYVKTHALHTYMYTLSWAAETEYYRLDGIQTTEFISFHFGSWENPRSSHW